MKTILLTRERCPKVLTAAGMIAAVLVASPRAFGDEYTYVTPPPEDTVVVEEVDDERDPGEETFFLTANGGYSFFETDTFEETNLTGNIVEGSASGPTAMAGIGIKLLFLTLGVTGTVTSLEHDTGLDQDYNLWTLDGEVGFRLIPVGRLQPYVLVGGGYSRLDGFGDEIVGISDQVDVDGFNLRGGVGLDYYLSALFSIGAQAVGEAYFLDRNAVAIADVGVADLDDDTRDALLSDGDSVGGGLRFTAGAGLHF